ncbi:transmembrane protein, putative [Bodo saltans]|uniref:Transmembrane protein, putative n=1 Tax=Bodo saltans TaxID=75058 RepID=A0A0S4JPS4_BODSA|nr:transmembrane protein, putative [Bodo saltans]|eukprot:CUG91376.1 transmembrane protein, putative [Bodo saltans]
MATTLTRKRCALIVIFVCSAMVLVYALQLERSTPAPFVIHAPNFVSQEYVDPRFVRPTDETRAKEICNATAKHIVLASTTLLLGESSSPLFPPFHKIAKSAEVCRHYPAMVRFLEALQRLRSSFPDDERCWDHWWHAFQDCAKDTVIGRMYDFFGGVELVGQLYIAGGFGEYTSRHHIGRNIVRKDFFPQDLVHDSTKKECVNFTIFFLGYDDMDIYTETKNDVVRRTALRTFLAEYPNFFFLHYSPSMVMPGNIGASVLGDRDPFYPDRSKKGLFYTLFPRMIPIPHFPENVKALKRIMANSRPPKPYHARRHQVVWRGSTTGYEKPFSLSDRSRVVAQFVDAAWADVAFSALCQGVTRREVPRFAGMIHTHSLMHYQVHLDIDGNTNSWDGLRWRLMFGMAVVKARSSNGYTQWYYPRLQNGVNIIEVPVDQVGEAARAVLNDVDRGANIASKAKEFGDLYLSFPAMERAVRDAVRNAWRVGYDDRTKWCISPC